MFVFGRSWVILPLLVLYGVWWVLWRVIALVVVVSLFLLQTIAPVLAAGATDLLGWTDRRRAGELETGAERRENGREARQERAAAAALRLGRW